MVIYGTTELSERRQARELLAWGAAEHWGLTPLPPLERGPMGKPFFAGLEGRCFNLSHSGTLALCALSDRPVGVDIQVVIQTGYSFSENWIFKTLAHAYRERG